MDDSNVSDCNRQLLVDWMDADWTMISMMPNNTVSKWKAQYVFSGVISACLFLLAVVTLFQTKSTIICRMHSCKKQVRNVIVYFYTLEVLIALMGLSRFLVNILNYATDGLFISNAVYVEAILSGMSLPCLTVGFTLLFLCLLQSALKLRLFSWMTRSCVNPKGILAMSLLHFVINISGQLLIKIDVGKSFIIRLCHLFFILWGAFLFLAFPIVGCYVRRGARGLHRRSMSERRETDAVQYKRLCILTSISSVAGLALCVLYCFAVTQMWACSIGSNDTWWYIALATRLVEFVMALLLLFTTVKTGKKGLRLFVCCKHAPADPYQEVLQGQGINTRNGEVPLCGRREANNAPVVDLETEIGVTTGHSSSCLSPADSGVSMGSISIDVDVIPIEGNSLGESPASAQGGSCIAKEASKETRSTEKGKEPWIANVQGVGLTLEQQADQSEADRRPRKVSVCYTV